MSRSRVGRASRAARTLVGRVRERCSGAPATETWLGLAELRRLRQRARESRVREDLIRQWAPGRSFVDVGGLWAIHGAQAFLAEQSGATKVTLTDITPPTEEFENRREESGSAVRFVRGDLHDDATLEQVGPHDIVWCTGVLYHVPSPLQTLEKLGSISRDLLMLGTQTVPEIPGVPQACVFWPGLSRRDRLPYTRESPGLGLASQRHSSPKPGTRTGGEAFPVCPTRDAGGRGLRGGRRHRGGISLDAAPRRVAR